MQPMQHSLSVSSLSEIGSAATEFLRLAGGSNIIAFRAPMGAGKTTFIKALCERLGVVSDAVGSPTFTIVNQYGTADGRTVYHFDFYRITKEVEALDIGLYDYLDSGCLCLIEWPEVIEDLMPEETLYVEISVSDDGTRTISWQDRCI